MISKNTLKKTIEIYVPSGIEVDYGQFQDLFIPQVNDKEIIEIVEIDKPTKQFKSGSPNHKNEGDNEKTNVESVENLNQELIEDKIDIIQEESFNQHSKRIKDKIAKRYGL